MQENLTIPATLEAVSKFTQSLETQLENLSAETRTLIVLALQELLVNVVEHAYAGMTGTIEIIFNLSVSELQVTITDQAQKAFDMPDDIALPDPLDLPEGGMGLFIIHQSFDRVDYKRLSDGNQWQLSKKLG